MKVCKVAEGVGISKDRVGHIMYDILGMRKGRLQRLLTPNNKHNRDTTSELYLRMFKRNLKEFLCRFATIDETWIHCCTPETKELSKQWTSPGERAPKKAKIAYWSER